MKLLIVDDNPSMRQLIKCLVQEVAKEFYECADGSEGLIAYARYRPDWVLMDIEMPTLDGLEATRQIKAAFPEARIIIVTNYDDAGLRQSASEAGAIAYVLKENLFDLRRLLGADHHVASPGVRPSVDNPLQQRLLRKKENHT